MPTFFLKHGTTTKRISDDLPDDIASFKELCCEKLKSTLSCDPKDIVLHVKDKDFGVECELEEVSQLYDGAMLTVQQSTKSDAPAPAPIKIEPSTRHPSSSPSVKRRLEDGEERRSKYRRLDVPDNDGSQSDGSVDHPAIPYKIPEGYYARLKGVPYNAKKDQVRDFLRGLRIADDGIFFARNPRGDCTGEVFVTFVLEDDLEQALKRHNEYMGRRYIEVERADAQDFEEKVKIGNGFSMVPVARGSHILKMKGFSYDASERVVRKFLMEHQPSEVHILYDHRNRNSGVVFCEFATREDCLSAFDLNKSYLGRRYIKMFHSSIDEMRLGIAEMIGEQLPGDLDPYATCLRLEGLPHQASKEEITQFFRPVDVVPTRIHSKRTGGTAYIEFATPNDLRLAITRNGFCIGSHRIALYQALDHELRAVGIIGGDTAHNTHDSGRTTRSFSRSSRSPISHSRRPSDYRRRDDDDDRRGRERTRERERDRGRRLSNEEQNRNDSGGTSNRRRSGRSASYSRSRSRSNSRSGRESIADDHHHSLLPASLSFGRGGGTTGVGGGRGPLCSALPSTTNTVPTSSPSTNCVLRVVSQRPPSASPIAGARGVLSLAGGVVGTASGNTSVGGCKSSSGVCRGVAGSSGGGTSFNPFSHFGPSVVGFNYTPLQGMGSLENSCPTGALVRIRGLPFETRPEEILEFFDGFRVDGKSLDMPRDENGRPSGQATIMFQTSQEAYRAVDQLDRKYLGRRYVLLDVIKKDVRAKHSSGKSWGSR